MLTSLIAVLLLLVIGFYTFFIGAVGRAGGGEAPLSAPRRLGMIVIGLAALGVAYLVYSHPRSLQSASRAPASWNAMPSNPPETRGDEASARADPSAEVAATDAPADIGGEAAAPAAAPTPEPTPIAEAPASESDGAVSAAALAMEAELLRRRRALAPIPGAPPAPVVVAEAPVSAAPVSPTTPRSESAAKASGAATKPTSPARRTTTTTTPRRATAPVAGPLQPLTIVIHNELGDRQEREKLSLIIEGKRVASFEITDATPTIELPVRLPRPGLIHYKLEGESVQGRRQSLRGQGCISAVDGARFHVRRNPGSQRVFLESTSG